MTSYCSPITRPVRSSEPTITQEPVTVAEAKRQLGLGDDADQFDSKIQELITSAREQVESDTNLVCYTGTYTWKFTEFPCRDWLELPDLRPVTSITSIIYVATDGTTTTWGSSNYTFESSGLHQFIRLNYGCTWPVTRCDINGVTVTMVAGYATVAAVPKRLKQAVLMRLTRDFEDREGMERTDGSAYERLCELLRTRSYS